MVEKSPRSATIIIGNESRETAYFLQMYLACYQAARYLTERDDWDGKALVASGNTWPGLLPPVVAALSSLAMTAV